MRNHAVVVSETTDALRAPLGVSALSTREREVLVLLAQGFAYSAVATSLHIGVGTVQSHVKRIYKKLGVTSKVGATAAAFRGGLLPN